MSVKRDGIVFQDDGLNPSYEKKRDAEAEQIAREVNEVLNMNGYAHLHKLFVEGIASASNNLISPSTDKDMLRYYQGVVNGISSVQSRFLEMSKEETDE